MTSFGSERGRVIGILALALATSQACSIKGADSELSSSSSGSSGQGGASTSSGMGGAGAGIGSSSSGQVGGNCAEASSEAFDGEAPADIIIAVDTSGSMDLEAQWTQQNMNEMVNIIAGSGIDAHVVMISSTEICVPAPLGSGSCPNDENLPGYRHVQMPVGSNDSLQKILATYPDWKDSLRQAATKTFFVVSDDDSDLGAGGFTGELLALDPSFQGFKFDAIVSSIDPWIPNTQCWLLSAAEGKVYKDLVAQTGGVMGDLCLQDFTPVFQDVATTVIQNSQIDCVYDIPPPAEGETIDFDLVNVQFQGTPGEEPTTIPYVPGGRGACGPDGGWYYDEPTHPTQIIFCDATCSAVQGLSEGKVTVVFGCATVIR